MSSNITQRGTSSSPAQIDPQELQNRIDDHTKYFKWATGILVFLTPIFFGIASFITNNIYTRIERLETEIVDLHKLQIEQNSQTDQSLIELYGQQKDLQKERDEKIFQLYEDKIINLAPKNSKQK